MKTRTTRLTDLVLIFALLYSGGNRGSIPEPVQPQAKSNPDKAVLAQTSGNLPLVFIQNQGQMDSRVAYYLQGQDTSVYFASDGVTFALSAPVTNTTTANLSNSLLDSTQAISPHDPPAKTRRWIIKLDFLGANPGVIPQGEQPAETVVSYFKGSPDQWHTGLPTYRRLVYPELWPGIDLVYSGSVNKLKYEFVVKPGADPAQIRLAYRGLSGLEVDDTGQMQISTPIRTIQDEAPTAYQVRGDKQIPVAAAYQVQSPMFSADGSAPADVSDPANMIAYSFQVSRYDTTLPVVIDPALLVYCGFIGGGLDDTGTGIAVDESGAAYVTGYTSSDQATFPVTGGPDLTYNGGDVDAFVVKVRPDGSGLVYAGYIGGSGGDSGNAIAVDGNEAAYVTGATNSDQTSFPVVGGLDQTYNGSSADVFVAKVRPDGTGIDYAGYIGGNGNEFGTDIAVDEDGAAYVTGHTSSDQTTFPVVVGPDLTYNGGDYDAFVAKVRPDGTGLVYAGYIGGSGGDHSSSIAVDGSGAAYLFGDTTSDQTTFPVTIGPDLTLNGIWDAFVAKVHPDGTGLIYAGYIGGNGDEIGTGIAVDGSGAVYITGYTDSNQTSFPVKGGPDLTFNGIWDAFVAKVQPDGTGLVYAGYLGGSGSDIPNGIDVDTSGAAYVIGYTNSDQTTFPIAGGLDQTFNGIYDAFVAKLPPEGDGFVYCGYMGGAGYDYGNGITVDGKGAAYVVGDTSSIPSTFPVRVGPDLTQNGNDDAFVAKIIIGSQLFLPLIGK